MTAMSNKPVLPQAVSRLAQVQAGQGSNDFAGSVQRRGRILVDIDQVLPDPANERKAFNNIGGLAESIKAAGGIIEPPTVVPHPEQDGKYLLTTGERRWRAARLAGLTQIQVIVGVVEEEQQRRLKSLISNVQREDLHIIELANAIQAMKEDRQMTNRDLVPLLGKSEQWIGGVLRVLRLAPEQQSQIMRAEKQVSYEAATLVARAGDEETQREMLDDALAGASVRELRAKGKEARDKGKGVRDKGEEVGTEAQRHKGTKGDKEGKEAVKRLTDEVLRLARRVRDLQQANVSMAVRLEKAEDGYVARNIDGDEWAQGATPKEALGKLVFDHAISRTVTVERVEFGTG